jgi:hypothetical protein
VLLKLDTSEYLECNNVLHRWFKFDPEFWS